jgi:superfamily I DNA and RNA helicase
VLSPTFSIFSRLEDKINIFNRETVKVMTEEQERIIEETELDKRKIFFGAAGTGKTFIAKEKAKRLAVQNKKVFLTCYNRSLANQEFMDLGENIVSKSFLDYLEEKLSSEGVDIVALKTESGIDSYYKSTLPNYGFDYFSSVSEEEKFDVIIVDEGQDFKEEWLICIESMLKPKGVFYIFADPNQNLF